MSSESFDFRSAIEAAIGSFVEAANDGDGARLAGMYDENATLLPPGSQPVKGRSNIQGFWQSFIDAGAGNPRLHTDSVESSGDLACEVGTWEATIPLPDGGTGPASGNYLVVWKRQPDGTVRMVADMFAPV